MKLTTRKLLRIGLIVLLGACGGWASMRLASSGVRLGMVPADALCYVELIPGETRKSVDFTLPTPLDSFKILVVSPARRDRFKLSITRGDTQILSAVVPCSEFGCGRDVQPGTYTLVVEQDPGCRGGKVYVSEHPLGWTGWQLYLRALVALVVLSAVWTWAARRSSSVKRRLISRMTFQYLMLAFLLVFTYLFFHEGGHALFAVLFGEFSFSGSDFFGLTGHPHSGLRSDAEVAPWQRATVSFAGPAVPTLIGWALFALWTCARGRRLREARPVANLYFTAVVLMCVFPASVVLPVQLLGMLSDGDWRGFINNVPGPLWLVKTLLWVASMLNLAVIVRVAIELPRVWRAHIAALMRTASRASHG